MNALFLSPHNDDLVLFSAFGLIRERVYYTMPSVITVLRSQIQEDRGTGITAAIREGEDAAAFDALDLTKWEQWPYLDTHPAWDEIEARLVKVLPDFGSRKPRVYAPAVEIGAHDHHNRVGALADEVFGSENVTHYLTYTVDGKSRGGREVEFNPRWLAMKHRALACYMSQITNFEAQCWPHFAEDLREYVEA